MKSIAADAIRFYYEQGNESAYLEKCRTKLDVVEVVLMTAREFDVEIKEELARPAPGVSVWAGFGTTSNGLFEAKFSTEIMISKLADVFHVLHEFSVKNWHERPVEPDLFGYGNTGYIMEQFNLHEALTARLTEHGYTELGLAEMEEVIPTLSFLEGVTIFGPQVKVQHALFQDFRGLCETD